MKWLEQPDQPEYALFARRWTEDKKWEVCIHRVMFGWRVQLFKVGSNFLSLNWCAGPRTTQLNILYIQLCLLIRVEGAENVVNNYPMVSDRKPFFLDPKFIAKVFELDYSEHISCDRPKTEINDKTLAGYLEDFSRTFTED
jgi:hypothetical protein